MKSRTKVFKFSKNRTGCHCIAGGYVYKQKIERQREDEWQRELSRMWSVLFAMIWISLNTKWFSMSSRITNSMRKSHVQMYKRVYVRAMVTFFRWFGWLFFWPFSVNFQSKKKKNKSELCESGLFLGSLVETKAAKKEKRKEKFIILFREKCKIRTCGPFDIWPPCYNTKYTIKPTQTPTPFQAPCLNVYYVLFEILLLLLLLLCTKLCLHATCYMCCRMWKWHISNHPSQISTTAAMVTTTTSVIWMWSTFA